MPAWAMPGEEVWATGLLAGFRQRFRARVERLRNQFPRIVVKYIATESGETARVALPEMLSAYLHAGDLQPKDW